jgi:AraC-like DNA-binding protein/quercetin dioxygenase-like cupin family protein
MDMKNFNILFDYINWFDEGELILSGINIYQIAEAALAEGAEIVSHIQFCDEITYIISGKGTVSSNGIENEVSAGDIHIISKGENHRILANLDSSLRYICVGYTFSEENADKENLIITTPAVVKDNGKIRVQLDMMINELYSDLELRNNMLDALFKSVLILIRRLYYSQDIKILRHENKNETAKTTVYNIIRYIDNNAADIINVNSIAKALSYSEYYVSRLFHEKVGMTLRQYLTFKKMQIAMQLLESGKLSVTEISQHLKYTSPQSFSRAFKKQAGISPGQYQKTANSDT